METNKTAGIEDDDWSIEIKPGSGFFQLHLDEVWRYRDLLVLMVRRDMIAVYKQTILGPIWFVIQPIMTTLMFSIVFGGIANISTEGTPKILFYLSGIVNWFYFSDSLNKTSYTFTSNASIFGKVYFPRIIMPMSTLISNMFKYLIQFTMFLLILAYYFIFVPDHGLQITWYALLTPLLLLMIAGIALGAGMIISAFTTKYKDLIFLLTFVIQLLMYSTTVIYPLSSIEHKYRWIIELNPMTGIIECFRLGFLGTGTLSPFSLLYSFIFTVVTVLVGMLIFNKVEKSFVDTV